MGDQNEDVESLKRILTRLALTEEDRLESVLSKLLPLVIAKLSNAGSAVQQAVINILTHCNKRLQAAPTITLPLEDLLNLYTSNLSPLVRSFSLVYVERAIQRATPEVRFSHLNQLLTSISQRPSQHQEILLRLAASSLEHLAQTTNIFSFGSPETFASQHAFLANDKDRKIFLCFAAKLMLYSPPSIQGPTSALAAGQAAMQTPGGLRTPSINNNNNNNNNADDDDTINHAALLRQQPGLSLDDISLIEGRTAPSAASILLQKLGLLNFTSLAEINPSEVAEIYLSAASSSNESVSRRGDELLKKRCSIDAHRPAVDLENPAFLEPLFELFLGSLDSQGNATAKKKQRAPASPALKSRLLSLFCKSVSAANASPYAMMIVTSCLFGDSGTAITPRLRQQGMEFAVWMLRHAEARVLIPAAPAIIESCLNLLDSTTGNSAPLQSTTAPPAVVVQRDTATLTLRSFVYQALGQLALRVPTALQGRVDIATRCFAAIAAEPAGVRAAVQEATSCLTTVFQAECASPENPISNDNNALSYAMENTASITTTSTEILTLLESAIHHTDEAVRGAAVQWAIRIFPFTYIPARYLCMVGCSDNRFQLSEAAVEGLKPHKFASRTETAMDIDGDAPAKPAAAAPHASDDEDSVPYPDLYQMIGYLRRCHPSVCSPVDDGRDLCMHPKTYAAAIDFLEKSREYHQKQHGLIKEENVLRHYFLLLENALVKRASAHLHSIALAAILKLASQYKTLFIETYSTRASLFEKLVGHVDASARDAAARLLGMLCSGMSADHVRRVLLSAMRGVNNALEGKKGVRYEQIDGDTAVLGYILAQLLFTDIMSDGLSGVTHGMTHGHKSKEEEVEEGKQEEDVLTAALSTLCTEIDAATSEIPSSIKATAALSLGYMALPLATLCSTAVTTASDHHRHLDLKALPALLIEKIPSIINTLASSLLKDKDAKVVKKTVQSLGFIAYGISSSLYILQMSSRMAQNENTEKMEYLVATLPITDSTTTTTITTSSSSLVLTQVETTLNDSLQNLVTSLLDLQTSKQEEVLFAVGEALCFAFGGIEVTPDEILNTPFVSLSLWYDKKQKYMESEQKKNSIEIEKEKEVEDGLHLQRASAMDIPAQPTSPRSTDTGISIKKRILSAIFDGCIHHPRPEIRTAGVTWLVSLLLFSKNTPLIASIIPQAQDALCSLLGDDSELAQEMASRGLAACYELAQDEGMKKALVDSLVGVLSGTTGRKRRAGDYITGDTKLFDEDTFGTAPPPSTDSNAARDTARSGASGGSSSGGTSGSLTTYKEICALATDLGQPDLVYKFMQLANHHATINASRGAAFGFASVAKLAGDALAPHVDALVPRLYRSLYDPQPRVRDAMQHIWTAVIDDPRAAISRNLDAVLKSLVADMVGNQWRVRESAALAASDALQGRRWEELRLHFASLWRTSLRVIDDVKESVRLAGMALMRSLRGLTFRLVDPELTPVHDGKEAVAAALPILLEMGLTSRVPEVQVLSVDTTAKLVKAAGAALVRPHMKIIVPAMIESLSGLEDARLNYVEQHAASLGLNSEKLEHIRVSAAQGSSVGDTLDMCARHMDPGTFAEVAPLLASLIRRGVGVNTRAGAGRFVAQVARRLGSEMNSIPANANTNTNAPTPILMKALQEAAIAERSITVRRSYASAHAVLAKHASHARVEKSILTWLQMYQSEDADVDAMLVAGMLLKSLAREAPDVFSGYASIVAPVAYLAQYSEDAAVAAVWTEIWEESTTSIGAGLRIHIHSVVDLALKELGSSQWGKKKAAAAAIVHLCEERSMGGSSSSGGGGVLMPHAGALMQALMAEVPGRLWDGKERVLTALGAACIACYGSALQAKDWKGNGTAEATTTTTKMMVDVIGVLAGASGKKKASYRKEALIQLKKVLAAVSSSMSLLNIKKEHLGGGVVLDTVDEDIKKTRATEEMEVDMNIDMKQKETNEEEDKGMHRDSINSIYTLVSPVLSQLVDEYTAAPAAGTAKSGGGDVAIDEASPLNIPIEEVAQCYGALWTVVFCSISTATSAGSRTMNERVECAIETATVLIASTRKVQEQTAAVEAGLSLALTLDAAEKSGDSLRKVWNAFLYQAKRMSEDGVSAALRQKAVELLSVLLKRRWNVLDDEEKKTWRDAIGEIKEREKMPAIQSQAVELLNALV